MIRANDIKNEEQAKYILDQLKDINTGVENYSHDSFEYENMCENIQEQFIEVLEYLELIRAEKITAESLAKADLIVMIVWDYLKTEDSSIERYNRMKNDILKLG